MKLLLDTHVLLAIVDERLDVLPNRIREILADEEAVMLASVASLWEIGIKVRIGKLSLPFDLSLLPKLLVSAGLRLLAIDEHHALADVQPEPRTRDPFDRLLLAQCGVESARLVTVDGSLVDHPLSATAK